MRWPNRQSRHDHWPCRIARSSKETAFAPTLVPLRTTDRNSWPAAVTLVSVAVDFQVAGSAAPSAQILNWIVEPTDPQPQPLLAGGDRLATGHRLQRAGDAVDVLLHRHRGRVGLQLQPIAVARPVGVLPATRTPQVDAEVAPRGVRGPAEGGQQLAVRPRRQAGQLRPAVGVGDVVTAIRPAPDWVSTVPLLAPVVQAGDQDAPSAPPKTSENSTALAGWVVTETAGLSEPTLPAASTARTV